ncbi:MAG: hypothetical protein JNK02_06825 [Planctomycetes bacterium]|nr:hypothetical protein [Planctomycetota bacterium]
MDAPPRAWVLNLDAEHELEARGSYAPTERLRAIVARQSARLVGPLVSPHDVVLTEAGLRADPELAERAHGLEGRAWSPTPRALALLARARAQVPDAPGVLVLRVVNARPFAALVRAPLVAGSFAKHVAPDRESVLALVARPAPLGWLVRRTFGAAGRGRRRLASGRPTVAELAWLDASLRLGPLVVEPFVEVVREHTRSGWVGRDGSVHLSRPLFQSVDARGAWTGSACASLADLARADDARLEAACAAAGAALAGAGYFGPFGIDAFHHRALVGAGVVLNPLSEINARFTMDWSAAMAADPRGSAASRIERLTVGG